MIEALFRQHADISGVSPVLRVAEGGPGGGGEPYGCEASGGARLGSVDVDADPCKRVCAAHLLRTAGDDFICDRGDRGSSNIYGGWSSIYGGPGDDRISGGGGNDQVYGGGGNVVGDVPDEDGNPGASDYLYGGPHDDELYGEGWNDRLDGNEGRDLLDGGSGLDDCRNGEDLRACE